MRVVPSQTNPVVEGVFQDNELSAIKYSHGKAAGLGWWIVLAGLGGFFLWASLAPLEKGVPLTGTVISSSSKKAIQHLTGGTVDAILVKEGDKIKKNDILVRMNRVQQNSNTEMVRGQYLAARISEARLMAEQDGKGRLVLPAALKDSRTDPRVQASLSVQQQLLTSRQAGLRQEMVANQSNIRGLILQGKGLEESLIGKRQRLVFMEEQLTGLRVLAGRATWPVIVCWMWSRALLRGRLRWRKTGEHWPHPAADSGNGSTQCSATPGVSVGGKRSVVESEKGS